MEFTIGIVFLALMVMAIALGVPIAFSLGATGLIGLWILTALDPALMQIALVAWKEGTDFGMVCIPLFILMGQVVYYSRIAGDLFRAVYAWMGNLPGGLAIASVFGCAAFGAVTGSSVACVATMGSIVIPEMKKYKYSNRLATGSLAASGTLGLLIPPSVTAVFYGILTETSIGDLFVGGVVPGILTAVVYSLIIYMRCRISPELGPPGPKETWAVRFKSLKGVTPVILLFLLVLGGLYLGVFTATEAAGVGAFAACAVGIFMRRLNMKGYIASLQEAGRLTAMVFAIIIGGILYARFMVLTGVTATVVDSIISMDVNRYVIVLLLVCMYVVLGMFLDVWGMLILTIPLVFPVMKSLGFDPVWFGVFLVIMTEMALLTPPVGANVYVIHGIAKDVPMNDIFAGVIPMLAGNLTVIALITAFPQLVLWLPSTMH